MGARTTLVLGGARSGKSAHAEGLAAGWTGRKVYVATAEARDQEMRDRIALHQERRGRGWNTVECPVRLEEALKVQAAEDTFLLIDCITLWVTNLLLGSHDIAASMEGLCRALPGLPGRIVIVSNEVGLGIVPDNALARLFRDHAGIANQQIARVADEVVFMAAGLPARLKG